MVIINNIYQYLSIYYILTHLLLNFIFNKIFKGNFHVNFDPKINEITRTAKYFERIGEEYQAKD